MKILFMRGLVRTLPLRKSSRVTPNTHRVPMIACMTMPDHCDSKNIEMPPRKTPWKAA